MRIVHPTLPGQRADVDELAFRLVWEPRGWVDGDSVTDLPDKTVSDVLDEVGDDQVKALAALAAEQDSTKPRTTLITQLERIAASAATTENTGD